MSEVKNITYNVLGKMIEDVYETMNKTLRKEGEEKYKEYWILEHTHSHLVKAHNKMARYLLNREV